MVMVATAETAGTAGAGVTAERALTGETAETAGTVAAPRLLVISMVSPVLREQLVLLEMVARRTDNLERLEVPGKMVLFIFPARQSLSNFPLLTVVFQVHCCGLFPEARSIHQ